MWCLLFFTTLTSAKVYLESVAYPINTQPVVDPLRGITKGDIWGPPVKGANKVQCGQFGADDYLGTRIEIKPKQPFTVNGVVGDPNGGGNLIFESSCGDLNPNFDLAGVIFWPDKLAELPVPNQANSFVWSINLQISDTHEPGPCTVQITYSPSDSSVYNNYQCVDIQLLASLTLVEEPVFWGVASVIIVSVVFGSLCLYSRRKKSKKKKIIVKTVDSPATSEESNLVDKKTEQALDRYAPKPGEDDKLSVDYSLKKSSLLSKELEVPEEEVARQQHLPPPSTTSDSAESKHSPPSSGKEPLDKKPKITNRAHDRVTAKPVIPTAVEKPLTRVWSSSDNEHPSQSYHSDVILFEGDTPKKTVEDQQEHSSSSDIPVDLDSAGGALMIEELEALAVLASGMVPPRITQRNANHTKPKWTTEYSKSLDQVENSEEVDQTEDTEDGDIDSSSKDNSNSQSMLYGSDSSDREDREARPAASADDSSSPELKTRTYPQDTSLNTSPRHDVVNVADTDDSDNSDTPLPPPSQSHPDDEEFVFRYD